MEENKEKLVKDYLEKKENLSPYRRSQIILYLSAIFGLYGTIYGSVTSYKLATSQPPYESKIKLISEDGWENTAAIMAYSKENETGTITLDGNTMRFVSCENENHKPIEMCAPMYKENSENLHQILMPNYEYTYEISPAIKESKFLTKLALLGSISFVVFCIASHYYDKKKYKKELEEYKSAKKLLKEYDKK